MDYPHAKFGDFGLSRFCFIVRTDRQTDRQNHYRPIDSLVYSPGVKSLSPRILDVQFTSPSPCPRVLRPRNWQPAGRAVTMGKTNEWR